MTSKSAYMLNWPPDRFPLEMHEAVRVGHGFLGDGRPTTELRFRYFIRSLRLAYSHNLWLRAISHRYSVFMAEGKWFVESQPMTLPQQTNWFRRYPEAREHFIKTFDTGARVG